MESSKNEKLEHLKSMVQMPKLYISNYFFSLRNEIDRIYVFKFECVNEWEEIIKKLNLHEKECLANINKNISDLLKKVFNEKIQLIEQHFNNGEDIEADILVETDKVKKILFSNKTITLINDSCIITMVNYAQFQQENIEDEEDNPFKENILPTQANEAIDYKLLIITDQYFNDQEISNSIDELVFIVCIFIKAL